MELKKNWEFRGTDWGALAFLVLLPIVAIGGVILHTWMYGFHWADLILLFVFYGFSGLSVTAGYHRCFSHRAYEAHPLLQLFYLIFGAVAIQHTALKWSRNHRIHHQYSDTGLDPHNVKQGFFHSHMGWIYKKTSLDDAFTGVEDLEKNPLVMWQHRYYWWLVLIVGVGLPMLIGSFYGRPVGAFLWAGLLRLLIQSHATYSVNSVAHTWGKQPFSINNEARDSWLLALISNGEGFHNFHHRFASDYRNGWRWYHWDPSKWAIRLGSWIGLTKNLKKASDADMVKAQMATQMQRLKQKLEAQPAGSVPTAFEEKLRAAKRRVETLAVQWNELKRQYADQRRNFKRLTKAERLYWRKKIQEARRDFELAKAQWAQLAASVAAVVATG